MTAASIDRRIVSNGQRGNIDEDDFDLGQSPGPRWRLISMHVTLNGKEPMTTGATIFVTISIMIFLGFGGLLAWAEKQTRDLD